MRKIRAAGAAVTVFLCLACALFLLCIVHVPVFAGGEGYELYYGNSSAPVVCTDAPLLGKLKGAAAGESARYSGERYDELKEAFGARLLFTEEAGGVVNYYLYSPKLGAGVWLCGKLVNLHIAVGGGRTTAGTPLIFGGA